MSLVYDDKIYSYNLEDGLLYIFQIELYYPEKNIIRKMKNTKMGNLFTIDKNIEKIKITVFDINNPDKVIVLKKKFTDNIDNNTILSNSDIIITLIPSFDSIVCNYKILF